MTHAVPWPREGIENVGGNFTESAAGPARTAPVDDTVNGALASRGRVAVRASVLEERSEASGLEISSDEPSRSAGASLVALSLSFVASADTDDVNHDGDRVSARGSANNRVSDQQAPVMATSEVEVEVGSRVATLSSVGSWHSHVTASSEGVVQVAARGVAEDSLDHTAQEEPLPKCSTSFSSETLRNQGPPDAELAGSLSDTGVARGVRASLIGSYYSASTTDLEVVELDAAVQPWSITSSGWVPRRGRPMTRNLRWPRKGTRPLAGTSLRVLQNPCTFLWLTLSKACWPMPSMTAVVRMSTAPPRLLRQLAWT